MIGTDNDWRNARPKRTPKRNHGAGRYTKNMPMIDRPFLCWDGEGSKNSPDEAQDYVLFGNSSGDKLVAPKLHTVEMLQFVIDQGYKHPWHIHVGFAFEYDVNMMLADLTPEEFEELADSGWIEWNGFNIQHIPHKWIQITKMATQETVRIADVFGFFQCSFLKAISTYIPDSPTMSKLEIVEKGKAGRNAFTYDEIEFITSYWTVEIQLLLELVNKLRTYLYHAGFMITAWHGPGALANFIYRTNGMKKHKSESDPEIYDAARYAYAGGRFELFNLGRHEQVYSYDINSAYPNAIAKLPSLSEGYWRHVDNPTEIAEFGVYRINLQEIERILPGPVFHRTKSSNIVYGWTTQGWYWSPEVRQLLATGKGEIIEGWEYVDFSTRPFTFVPEYYKIRQGHKARGEGVQMAYKLGLNSLYGKMAQRVGGKDGPPEWHQLEWAGWVTSYTRAMLYELMSQIPFDQLVGVETDGLYTTASPDQLGLADSPELGGWEINRYDEMLYLQSGMYAYRKGEKWDMKYRGLDKGTLTPESMRNVLENSYSDNWPVLTGPTTRFIGYRSALTHPGEFYNYHNHWVTSEKQIRFGQTGKRIHEPTMCNACYQGKNAYEMPHTLTIAPIMELESWKHDIPWIDDGPEPEWRESKNGENAPWNISTNNMTAGWRERRRTRND